MNAPMAFPDLRGLRIRRRAPESIRPSTPRPARRDCHGRLLAALIAMAGDEATITDSGMTPWCSATFVGARHHVDLRIDGAEARGRAEAFSREWPDRDVALPGHVVVEMTVDSIEDDADSGAVIVALSLLTIESW